MSDAVIERVTRMVAPLLVDLKLDLYDIEFRGGVLRITLDTPPGSPGGVDIDTISLVTRMISRDFDHDDPMPGSYTLEVTSPGLERTLRTPAHFQREVGKTVALRLRDVGIGGDRRAQGTLVSATDTDCTIMLDEPTRHPDGAVLERTIAYTQIDRAKTVFVWAAQPKPGKAQPGTAKKPAAKKPAAPKRVAAPASSPSTPITAPQEAS
jgi:ribosome maturation factor RimP